MCSLCFTFACVQKTCVRYLHAVSYPRSASHAGLQVLRVTSGARQQQVRPVVRTLVGAVDRQLRHVVQDVLCRDEGKGRSSAGGSRSACRKCGWLFLQTSSSQPSGLCLLQGKGALDDVSENTPTLQPGVRLAVLMVRLANEETLLGEGPSSSLVGCYSSCPPWVGLYFSDLV